MAHYRLIEAVKDWVWCEDGGGDTSGASHQGTQRGQGTGRGPRRHGHCMWERGQVRQAHGRGNRWDSRAKPQNCAMPWSRPVPGRFATRAPCSRAKPRHRSHSSSLAACTQPYKKGAQQQNLADNVFCCTPVSNISDKSGKAQKSPSLHKKELSPHQIQRPRRFAFVCSVESFNLMSLGSHLVSTGAALVLLAAHRHWENSANKEPSIPKICPTPSIPQVQVGERHLCGPSRLSSPLQRKRMKLRGWAQPPSQSAQGQWRGSRQQEQWEVTPQHLSSWGGMAPGTNLMDRHSKTFSRHHPSNSCLLLGKCLSLQLLPHLLP